MQFYALPTTDELSVVLKRKEVHKLWVLLLSSPTTFDELKNKLAAWMIDYRSIPGSYEWATEETADPLGDLKTWMEGDPPIRDDSIPGTVKEPKSEYTTCCILCNTTEGLQMVPHRSGGKLVGWIFACALCADAIYGRDIVLMASRT